MRGAGREMRARWMQPDMGPGPGLQTGLPGNLLHSLGATRHVLHLFRVGRHYHRKTVQAPKQNYRFYHVSDGNRSDRVVVAPDILRRSRPQTQVDRLRYAIVCRLFLHLFAAPFYFRPADDHQYFRLGSTFCLPVPISKYDRIVGRMQRRISRRAADPVQN